MNARQTDHLKRPVPVGPALRAGAGDPLQCALLTTRQMSEVDRFTVASGLSSDELMGNAGKAVAREIEKRWSPRPVVVLCGPGNNGGDGFVTARRLSEMGWPVRVALLGPIDGLIGAARHHAERWNRAIEPMSAAVLDGAAMVVDAIFGAGFGRTLDGVAGITLAAAAKARLTVVAIDTPSGVMGDTGESRGAVAAVLTVTFCRKKPGHVLLPGRMLCGEVVVADIGTLESAVEMMAPVAFENQPALWLAALPRPQAGANKYQRGHALVSGGYPMTGAARLAARGAARIGAGLTTIAAPTVALPIYAAALTSVMVQPVNGPDAFAQLLSDPRYSALLVGPGAGAGAEESEATRARTLAMLATRRPTVIDADALTAFQSDTSMLQRAINGPCVLTPHDGEFKRLFDVTGDKLSRTQSAARGSGAVVVLKGADTVIAAPDGRVFINANAPPTLATAGTGDVLAGFVLGLLAQGMEPFLAAAAAVWLHGAAAADFGPGLVAEDLPDLLPAVLRRLHGWQPAPE